MKTYIAILVAILAGLIAYQVGKHRRNMDGYGFAAEWGCYQGAHRACNYLSTDEEIDLCQTDALRFCPQAGEVFKKFMKQGSK